MAYVLVLFRKLNITTELSLKIPLPLCNPSTFTEEIAVFQLNTPIRNRNNVQHN